MKFCAAHQVYGDCDACIANMTPAERSQRARGAFHVAVGQVGRAARNSRCEWTLPLFPLVLILDADGTLADGVKHLVGKVQA